MEDFAGCHQGLGAAFPSICLCEDAAGITVTPAPAV